jgi:hypothetical protein
MSDALPTFIIGSQRSGTTMFRLMLNNHPDICVPHESVFITVFYRKLDEYGNLNNSDNMRNLLTDISAHPLVVRGKLIPCQEAVLACSPTTYAELITAIFDSYAAQKGKSLWCDKTPFYTEDIDLLNNIFPNSRFIHIVRDGRDVALSQKNMSWLSSNLPNIARQWQHKAILCHKVGAVLGPARFLEIKYEDLVLNTESTLQDVCRYLGVNFSKDMLNYHEEAENVVPGESIKWHTNSIKKPDPAKVLAWRTNMPRSDRVIFEQFAGDALEMLGYERENLKHNAYSKLREVYYTAVQRH